VWEDDPSLFLIEDVVSISMTPRETLAFVLSRRWERERSIVTQYRVRR
jgi:hypothetical protein